MAEPGEKKLGDGTNDVISNEDFQKFWSERHYGKLLRFTARLTRDRKLAEEILQESIALLGERIEKKEKLILKGNTFERALMAYIRKIIRGCIANHFRAWDKEQSLTTYLGLQPAPVPLGPARKLPLDEIINSAFNREMSGPLRKLPRQLRLLFQIIVNNLDARPQDQWLIWAEEMGFDPKDIKKRASFYKIRERLRRRLQAFRNKSSIQQ